MDETFGAVTTAAALEGTIELVGRMNGPYATHEFSLRVRIGLKNFTFEDESKKKFLKIRLYIRSLGRIEKEMEN